jgi:peptidoglycan/LPS O-acetylase OafA/YrhL
MKDLHDTQRLPVSMAAADIPAGVTIVFDRGYAIDTVLECCRGVAALWVFMFHIADMFEAISPGLFALAKLGHYGVPLFFAISGYCMFASAESTLSKHQTGANFLKRRCMRVLPPFWLSVLVVLAMPFIIAMISAAKSGRYEWPQTAWMAFSVADWAQLLTLTRAIFRGGDAAQAAFSPVNAVYWTLAIEMQFYLVLAGALYFKPKWKRVVLIILCLSLATLTSEYISAAVFLPYWPAFVLGMGLRIAHLKGFTPAWAFGARETLFSFIGTVLLLGISAVLLLSAPLGIVHAPLPGILGFTGVAFASILVLWGLGGVEHGIRYSGPALRTWRPAYWALFPLCWVGQSSYSLYLLHGKINQLPAMVIRQFLSERNLAYPLLTMVFTAALCFVFYTLFEKPFQHGGSFHLAGKCAAAAIAGNKQPQQMN